MNEAGGVLYRVHQCTLKDTGLLFGNKLWWGVIDSCAPAQSDLVACGNIQFIQGERREENKMKNLTMSKASSW